MAFMPLSVFGSESPSNGRAKMRVRIIYSLHAIVQPKPDWPNVGFDFNPVLENMNYTLAKKFPAFKFLPTLATGEEDAEKIMNKDQE
jgi:hypothetical protein